jgi:hypothetical protein
VVKRASTHIVKAPVTVAVTGTVRAAADVMIGKLFVHGFRGAAESFCGRD